MQNIFTPTKATSFRRRLLVSLLAILALAIPAGTITGQEPNAEAQGRTTAVALNYCRASFHRIRRCASKRVLIEEQDKILNNLNLNQIADEEVVRLYTAVLDEIAQVQIAEKDREFIREMFRRAALRRLTETGFQLGAQALTAEYVGMVRTGVNSWWDYRDMDFRRDNDSWRIDKLRMEALVNKSSIFLDTFWKMARKRSMQDRWLIRNSDLDELEKAMREPDLEVRLRVLKRMENFMECYPPYWYYLARTQQALGQLFAAIETYQKLVAMGDGHFRKDEMLAAGLANLSAIQDYLNQPSAPHNAREALRRSLDVWEVNLTCARVLERHACVDEAEDAILRNLDTNLERDQSRLGLLSLYYRTGKSEKLAAAIDDAEVARSIPADALICCASVIETERLPKAVIAALVESFDAHFGGRDLVLRATRNWNLEGAQLSAAHGEQKFANPRLAVANGQYEVRLRPVGESTASQSGRGADAEPIMVAVKYGDSPEIYLTLQPVTGAVPDATTNAAGPTNVLISVLKLRRNGYRLAAAVTGDKTVVLQPATARTMPETSLVRDLLQTATSTTTPSTEPQTVAPAPSPSTPESPSTIPAEPAMPEAHNETPNGSPAPTDRTLPAPPAEGAKQPPVQKAF